MSTKTWNGLSGLKVFEVPDRTEGSSYELWEHGQSGAVFAVRLDRARRITGCSGPLFSNQIRPGELAFYSYDEDPRDLRWIEQHRENWDPAPVASPPHC
jgi:hypothetical protein